MTRKGVFSDTVPLDQVIDLQPPTELHRGQPVTLVVSLGPELIEIPDVAGKADPLLWAHFKPAVFG